ncbi:MAG: LysR family transcriptional regulator [Erysipelotrichaceae bacterium]|nr:LysR family transcriptional regulator [Erysipelotrichaceae bacterium]
MNTDQLKYFVALSESRSFNKAASKFEMTTSNLKRRFDLLEDELNVKLFNRSNQGLTLTPEGEIMLEKAKNVLALIDDMLLTYKESNEFILGCDSFYVPDLVEDYFEDFCREKGFTPKLFAEYRYTEMQKRLLHGDMEAFIALEEELPEGIHFKKIRADKCFVVSAPDMFNSNTITIGDLNNRTIFLDDKKLLKHKVLFDLFSENGVSCNIIEGAPQAEAMRAVRNGEGLIIVQESFIRYFSRDLQFAEIKGYTVNSGLYYKTLTGKLLDFIDFIKKGIE